MPIFFACGGILCIFLTVPQYSREWCCLSRVDILSRMAKRGGGGCMAWLIFLISLVDILELCSRFCLPVRFVGTSV